MIRKFYKLRHYVYIIIGLLLIFFIFNRDTLSNKNFAELQDVLNNIKNVEQFFDNLEEKKSRITIDTYVSPEPCINCPGENGSAVIILVSK
jgi:hypothetical protein